MQKRNEIIPAVYLLLERHNQVLLMRRYQTGYMDGNYTLVSGHVEEGESIISAVAREAKEEAGILIKKDRLQLVHVLSRLSGPEKEERVDFFWKCDEWEGEASNMEPEKCDHMTWFKTTDLPNEILPFVKQALENIEQNIQYSEFGW